MKLWTFFFVLCCYGCSTNREYVGTWEGTSHNKPTIATINSDNTIIVKWGDKISTGYWETDKNGRLVFYEKKIMATAQLVNSKLLVTEEESTIELSPKVEP